MRKNNDLNQIKIFETNHLK